MLLASDFRRIARDSLMNRWGLAIGTGLVAGLLGAATQGGGGSSSGSSSRNVDEIMDLSNSGFFQSNLFFTILPFITIMGGLVFLWAIALIIIGGATTLGYAKFNLNIVDLKEAKFKDIFSQYHRIGAGFCMQFLRGLYILLWSLLFIIPGIIAGYSYSMTSYIMAENPDLGANDAIGYSKEMMRGNKWRLFCLQISFIGWTLLALITCGIGMIVVNPYMEAATAAFYREVSGTYQQNNPSAYYGGYYQQNQYYDHSQYDQLNQPNQYDNQNYND